MLSRFKMSNGKAMRVMCVSCLFNGTLHLVKAAVEWQSGSLDYGRNIAVGGIFFISGVIWLISLYFQSRNKRASAYLEEHSVIMNFSAILMAAALIFHLVIVFTR